MSPSDTQTAYTLNFSASITNSQLVLSSVLISNSLTSTSSVLLPSSSITSSKWYIFNSLLSSLSASVNTSLYA